MSYRSSAYWKLFWARIMCLFFWPRRPMYMPQLLTGTSMPANPPLKLLPTLASNHSMLTRSPGCKFLICLSTRISLRVVQQSQFPNLSMQVIANFNHCSFAFVHVQISLAILCLLKLFVLLRKAYK